MSISEVADILEACGIDFDEIGCGSYGVRVVKYEIEKPVPIFWFDDFEKLEEVCELLMDVKNKEC